MWAKKRDKIVCRQERKGRLNETRYNREYLRWCTKRVPEYLSKKTKKKGSSVDWVECAGKRERVRIFKKCKERHSRLDLQYGLNGVWCGKEFQENWSEAMIELDRLKQKIWE